LETFLQDLRFSLRSIRRNPLFTAIAVLCLTLGIAVNTTVFSIFNAILLRPFDFSRPEELVVVREENPKDGNRTSVAWQTFKDWGERTQTLTDLAASGRRSLAITEGDEPERLQGAAVSANLFPMLGVRTQLGRLIRPDEDEPGSERVVLMSDAVWRRRYAGDSAIIGRTIQINGVPHTVVGVMLPRFQFPETVDLWVAGAPLSSRDARTIRSYDVYARLKPTATKEQADREMAAISRALDKEFGLEDDGYVAKLNTLRETFIPANIKLISFALMGAVTFVLLIACANVANLFLTRATARRREIALRTALGAGRWRIVRQLVTESVAVAMVAGLLALPLTYVGLGLIDRSVPAENPIPYYIHWSVDTPTLLYTFLISLATGIVFGLVPALQATKGVLHGALKEGGRGSAGAGGNRLRNTLVVAEVALSLILLVGASLFVRSFLTLQTADLGFSPKPLMTMRFYLAGQPYDSNSSRAQRVVDIQQRVEALPNVESAAISNLVPIDGGGGGGRVLVDSRSYEKGQEPYVQYAGVTTHWLETIGARMLSGRTLTNGEARDSVPVAVVNQRMANLLWPKGEAVGRRFRFTWDSSGTWFTVVGVHSDFLQEELDDDRAARPAAFVGFKWMASRFLGLTVRVRGDPAAATPAIRSAIRQSDAGIPVFDVATMDHVRRASFWQYALFGSLFSVFGAIALFLAAIGIYGVISFGVQQRTQEIGVRLALGAGRRDVLGMVVGQGVQLAAIGVGVGLLGAFAITRLLTSLLVGVSATDPLSFGGVALSLTAIAVLASYIPARRASAVDPMVALRGE
jgi:predicted permease